MDPHELRVAGWLASHADHWIGSLSRNAIARRTGVSQGKVSAVLQRLAEKGIVAVTEIELPQSEGGRRLQIAFNWEVWEEQPRSSGDRAPVTTRPGPGHDMTTSGVQEEEQREEDPPTPHGGAIEFYDEGFDDFWNAYPDKSRSSKGKTHQVWKRMKVNDRQLALQGIRRHVLAIANAPRGTFVLPAATVWLNQSRWMDEEPLRPPGQRATMSSGGRAVDAIAAQMRERGLL